MRFDIPGVKLSAIVRSMTRILKAFPLNDSANGVAHAAFCGHSTNPHPQLPPARSSSRWCFSQAALDRRGAHRLSNSAEFLLRRRAAESAWTPSLAASPAHGRGSKSWDAGTGHLSTDLDLHCRQMSEMTDANGALGGVHEREFGPRPHGGYRAAATGSNQHL
jgi:hypothetical protein